MRSANITIALIAALTTSVSALPPPSRCKDKDQWCGRAKIMVQCVGHHYKRINCEDGTTCVSYGTSDMGDARKAQCIKKDDPIPEGWTRFE